MPRPTKKTINLTKDSMLSLMQEIYNELVEQRDTAIRIQNKMLTLSKLQSTIWQKSTEKEEDFTLSDMDLDDETIQNLIQKDISDDKNYKMKK